MKILKLEKANLFALLSSRKVCSAEFSPFSLCLYKRHGLSISLVKASDACASSYFSQLLEVLVKG